MSPLVGAGSPELGNWTEVTGHEPGAGAGMYLGSRERRLRGSKGAVMGMEIGKAVAMAASALVRSIVVLMLVML